MFRTYGGFSNDQNTQQERDNLLASLSEDDKKLVEPGASYYLVGYDPPFKLFFRRNEIWFVLKDGTSAPAVPVEKESSKPECKDTVE